MTYGLGRGHAVQLVFVKQLRETHMAEQRELLVSGGWSCGWKLPVFSLPPLSLKEAYIWFYSQPFDPSSSSHVLLDLCGPAGAAAYCQWYKI